MYFYCHNLTSRNVFHFNNMTASTRAKLTYSCQIVHACLDSRVVYVKKIGVGTDCSEFLRVCRFSLRQKRFNQCFLLIENKKGVDRKKKRTI